MPEKHPSGAFYFVHENKCCTVFANFWAEKNTRLGDFLSENIIEGDDIYHISG